MAMRVTKSPNPNKSRRVRRYHAVSKQVQFDVAPGRMRCERFLDAWLTGDFRHAAALCQPGVFWWFGLPLSSPRWARLVAKMSRGKQWRSQFALILDHHARAKLDSTSLAASLAMPVAEADCLFLYDLYCPGRIVTVGLVASARRIKGVFDPTLLTPVVSIRS
jgi:hypothetical protein